MIENKSINEGLDAMTESANEVAGKDMSNQIVNDSDMMGKTVNLESEQPVFSDDDPEQVAGLGISKYLKKGGKYIEEKLGQSDRGEVIDEALSGVDMQFKQKPKMVDGKVQVDEFGNTIYEYEKDAKGNLIPKDIEITKPTQRKQNYTDKDRTDAKKTTADGDKLPDDPEPISTDPVSIKKAEEIAEERQKFIDDPLAKRKELIKQGINEGVYDDETFVSTIAATSKVLAKDRKIQTTTLADLKKKAYERGIPEHIMERRLAGYKFDSTVGGNDLAIKTMALMDEFDKSAQYIDTLMMRAADKSLSEPDKFNLLQQLKMHQIIEAELMGVKQDVATAMNTFKRIKRSNDALDVNDFTTLIDENMSDKALTRLADLYLRSDNRQTKNLLLRKQKGGFKKLADSAYYTFMSNILNDVKTWSENLVGSAIHGVLLTTDDLIIGGMNTMRRKLGLKRSHDQELDDMVHSLLGLKEGFMQSLASMSYVVKTGNRAGYKSEKRINPLSAENFSNTTFKNPFSDNGKVFFETGELQDTFIGNALDTAGFIQSISMRALAGGDEIIGTSVANMALRKEASKYVKRRLGELADEGVALDVAKKRVSTEVAAWATELPADIHTSMKEVKDLIQFTYNWDKTKMLDNTYASVNKFLNAPVIRYMVPFSNTLTKIFDQGASRIPILNFISPQFYKDWSRGGYFKDRAKARLMSGLPVTMYGVYGASEGSITGGGPRDPSLKRNLSNTGWQQYSFVRDKSKFTDEQLTELKKLTNVNIAEDKVYISYQRFDILSQVLAAGVDFHDLFKHYRGDPESNVVQDFTLATLGATSKFMENLPFTQFLGDLVRLTNGNFENEGDKWIALLNRAAEQGLTSAALTVPFASSALQSSATAHVARIIDEDRPSKLPDEVTIQGTLDFTRAYERSKKAMLAKVPFVRGDLTQDLDELGRPIYNKNTINQEWQNAVPFVSLTRERRSRVDEQLIEYNISISMPSEKLEKNSDALMSAPQMVAYKSLYGQQITKEYTIDGKKQDLNLVDAITNKIDELEEKYRNEGLTPEAYPVEEVRKEVKQLVASYREDAKEMMLGVKVTPEDGMEAPYYTGETSNGDAAMFPELVEIINRELYKKHYGR